MIRPCELIEKTTELIVEMGLTSIQERRVMKHIKKRVDLVSKHQHTYVNVSTLQLVNMIKQVSDK